VSSTCYGTAGTALLSRETGWYSGLTGGIQGDADGHTEHGRFCGYCTEMLLSIWYRMNNN
ncbi:TPA: hypothetical protein ACODKK_004710, partial [Salmonella enterica subsp. enterica serovar Freetown]